LVLERLVSVNNMLLAQNLDTIQSQGLPEFKTGSIGSLISAILPYIFGAAALMLLVYLVTAGLSMMTSRGDPKAMQAAQAKITNALIGFVIVFFAFALVSIIGRVFGITVFGSIFGGNLGK
jgi:hypothetical protein